MTRAQASTLNALTRQAEIGALRLDQPCAPASRLTGGTRADTVPRSDLRHRRRARRLAAPEGVAGVAARADGQRMGRHPRPDDLVARDVHAPRLPDADLGQATDERRPGGPGVLS